MLIAVTELWLEQTMTKCEGLLLYIEEESFPWLMKAFTPQGQIFEMSD